MRNLTLAIDDDLLLKARKLALERNTTVNQLVREFLEELVTRQSRQKAALGRLEKRLKNGILRVGSRTWTRDELHAR